MARQVVELQTQGPTVRGQGRLSCGAVTYRPDYSAAANAQALQQALGTLEGASRQRDQRLIEESNAKFKAEFETYVNKALSGDNTTGIEELDTLYPDMNMSRKILILEASGKRAMQNDEGLQSILSGIGAENVDEDGNKTGTPNTLAGIKAGYQQAEQYIRDNYKDSNGAFLSGALSVMEAAKATQLQNYVLTTRAAQLADTRSDFTNTDKALAATGDFEALAQQDALWNSLGGNTFIKGGDRNATILNSVKDQAVASRNIDTLLKTPEVYKGSMRGKPELWQTYIEGVRREIAAENAKDVTARLTQRNNIRKEREDFLRTKMLEGKPLSGDERKEMNSYPELVTFENRLQTNLGTPKHISALNKGSIINGLQNLRDEDDFSSVGDGNLTPEILQDQKRLTLWASTQDGIHPEDVPAIQEAYWISEYKKDQVYLTYEDQVKSALQQLRNVSILEEKKGMLGIENQDSAAYANGLALANQEFKELVEIAYEDNGNQRLSAKQLRQIRMNVLATVKSYVESFNGITDPTIIANQMSVSGDYLATASERYVDEQTNIQYEVMDESAAAAQMAANDPNYEIRQVNPGTKGAKRFIKVRVN